MDPTLSRAEPAALAPAACPSCGAPLPGSYCPSCGQKNHVGKDRSVRVYLGEFFHAISHLDGRFWSTLRRLAFRPGALTAEFIGGAHQRAIAPLHLFLFGNVLYFFFTVLNDLNPTLHEQGLQPYAPVSNWLVARKLAALGLDFDAYAPLFNAASANFAKSLVVICVPVFALFLRLVHRRRPNTLYYDDLVFSTHFFTFVILLPFTIVPLVLMWTVFPLVALLGPAALAQVQSWALLSLLVWMVIYLFLSLRRVFPAPAWVNLLKTLYGLVALFLTGLVYKFVLLLVTLAKT